MVDIKDRLKLDFPYLKWESLLWPRLRDIAEEMGKKPVNFRISDDTWWELEKRNDSIYTEIECKWREILKDYSGKDGIAVL